MLRRAGLRRRVRREPDHVLKTTITTQYGSVPDVLCRVYLPRTVMANPYLHFEPSLTRQQLGVLMTPEFSFEGKTQWQDQTLEITAPIVFTQGCQEARRSADVVEYSLPGEPWDLQVIKRQKPEARTASIKGAVFWLTPNRLLSHALFTTVFNSGNVDVKTVRETVLAIAEGKLRFRRHFEFRKVSQGNLRYSQFVAEFDGQVEPSSFEKVVEQLDDLLLLASLATRQACLCRGWQINTEYSQRLTYRSRLAVPRIRKIEQQETLIDTPDFDEFITHAFDAFRHNPARERIRQAINLLVTADDSDLVNAFLKVFTALETVTTFQREIAGQVSVLGSEAWPAFQRDLEAFIKKHPCFEHEKSLRKLIYEKIPELNRVSFATAFFETISAFQGCGLRVDDLWPVTGTKRGLSLAEVRNRIVHGVVFTPTQEEGLFTAKIHLAWCVERLLLAALRWPIERSLVGRFLKHMKPYHDWKWAQEALAR